MSWNLKFGDIKLRKERRTWRISERIRVLLPSSLESADDSFAKEGWLRGAGARPSGDESHRWRGHRCWVRRSLNLTLDEVWWCLMFDVRASSDRWHSLSLQSEGRQKAGKPWDPTRLSRCFAAAEWAQVKKGRPFVGLRSDVAGECRGSS